MGNAVVGVHSRYVLLEMDNFHIRGMVFQLEAARNQTHVWEGGSDPQNKSEK